MSTLSYQIEFFSYWHASSGLTGGTYADLLVNRTREGLPYIPGRTLKGLLREAAETMHGLHPELINAAFIQQVFGQKPTTDDEENENYTKAAEAFFTNATLSPYLVHYLSGEGAATGEDQAEKKREIEEQKKHLFKVVASTAIDGSTGTAKEHTLRQLEVTVPLTLQATIEQFPDTPGYQEMMAHCMKWVKRMGLNRTRGLGRCKLSLTQSSQA